MQIDASRVIEKYMERNQQLEYDNAIKEVQIDALQAEINELKGKLGEGEDDGSERNSGWDWEKYILYKRE